MKCPRRMPDPHGVFAHIDEEWRSDGTCSYCGSFDPDQVIKLIEEGCEVIPTDKDYKLYVKGFKKVYFQHFDMSHKKRFVELYNAKTMNIASPGYFYVMPFFMVPA